MLHDTLAVLFLILLAFTALVAVAWDFRRCQFTLVQYPLWWFARAIAGILWRAKIPTFPLDTERGAIIICNHRSSIDPAFIQAVVRRPVHWMVAREYYQHPLFSRFLRICETIAVGRGGIDTAATKQAIRLAGMGGLVGMFPEGRINATEQLMLACRPGAVLVAIKANALLLPCYIEGAPFDGTPLSPLTMPAQVRVSFGQAIDVSDYRGREKEDGLVADLMIRCMRSIAELAGQPDFQPALAGRKWRPTDQEVAEDMEAARRRRRES